MDHQDLRSQFERDYDRAVFCTPVRRLQDKAQVFVLETHDAVRTRLTHSIEVSTVARDLTHAATVWMRKGAKPKINNEQALHIETIAATCGLVHDLGNPPFGHAGETAISSWFKDRQRDLHLFKFNGTRKGTRKAQLRKDFLSFEGNAQTIRLLSKLQLLANMHGLNLTYGTLSAACKYTASSDSCRPRGDHEMEKPGFFASENDLVDRVRDNAGTGSARNPITFLVEAADDIVYSTVDIEDAVKKGIVHWDFVWEEMKKDIDPDIYKALEKKMEGYIGSGSISADGGVRRGEVYSQTFRIFAISRLVPSLVKAFREKYEEIMAGDYHGELVKDCADKSLVKACKNVGKRYIYCSNETMRLEVMGREIIHDLMDLFWEGASHTEADEKKKTFPSKIYSLMSENYRTVFKAALNDGKLPEEYCRMQLVTDYICGMTDSFARNLHQQLQNG